MFTSSLLWAILSLWIVIIIIISFINNSLCPCFDITVFTNSMAIFNVVVTTIIIISFWDTIPVVIYWTIDINIMSYRNNRVPIIIRTIIVRVFIMLIGFWSKIWFMLLIKNFFVCQMMFVLMSRSTMCFLCCDSISYKCFFVCLYSLCKWDFTNALILLMCLLATLVNFPTCLWAVFFMFLRCPFVNICIAATWDLATPLIFLTWFAAIFLCRCNFLFNNLFPCPSYLSTLSEQRCKLLSSIYQSRYLYIVRTSSISLTPLHLFCI